MCAVRVAAPIAAPGAGTVAASEATCARVVSGRHEVAKSDIRVNSCPKVAGEHATNCCR